MRAGTPREFAPTAPIPSGTVLLEASAGTGKTYTITSLILRFVAEEDVSLEKILVVTFTRAAAAELRGRVRSRLTAASAAFERALGENWDQSEVDTHVEDEVVAHLLREGLKEGEDEVARRHRRLRSASESLDSATIDTIHGFCQKTLQRAAPDVDLEIGAELVEDVAEVVDEVVQDALVRELRYAEEDWYRFLSQRGIGPGRLRKIAGSLENEPYLQLLPDRPDLTQREPNEVWVDRLERFRNAWREQGEELAKWLAEHSSEGFHKTYYNRKRPAKEAAAISAWCDVPQPPIGDLGAIHDRLVYVSRTRIEDKLLKPEAMPDHLDVIDAADELLAAPAELETQFLLRFAEHVREELPRRKKARGLMSFTDLLFALERALSGDGTREAVRAGIRDRFDVALIDEFQDTDPIQWSIFDSVFGDAGQLQLIGDPKQAIYGFRGADMRTYLVASRRVDDDKRFTLSVNYRSDQGYIDALNVLFGREGVFEPEGAFAVEDIDYVEARATESLKDDGLRFEDGRRPALELRYVPRRLAVPEAEQDVDNKDLINKGWADQHLPRIVAGEIADFLSEGPEIHAGGNTWRELAPWDIAVLVRTNVQARRVQAALQDAGVPAVVGSNESVFDSPEAAAVQRLLEALLEPGSDRKVRAAFAGPILGWRARDLASPDEELWDDWLEKLERWSLHWRRDGVATMLREVFAAARTAPRLLSHPSGRSLTNLLHLGELLHAAETRERLGAEGLTAWLGEQRAAQRPSGDELELRLESDAGAVSVVTVHRAKGLQYPVVWCPFLWDGRLMARDAAEALRFHDPETGDLSLDLDAAKDSAEKQRNLRHAERETWQENLRLLYVALTRARHRCVVHTGPFNGAGSSPLQRILHGADYTEAGAPPDPVDRTDGDLLAELRSLSDEAITVTEVERLDGSARWEPPESADVDLTVRKLDRGLDTTWQRTSFSLLVSGDADYDDAPPGDEGDLDQDGVQDVEETHPPSDVSEVPLASFPRGAEPGTFLHKVLERLDFESARDVGELERALEEPPQRYSLRSVHRSALIRGIQGAITTPLGPLVDDRTLSSIDTADRLNELGFDLPLAGGYGAGGTALTVQRIADVFDAHAEGSPAPLSEYAHRLRQRPELHARGFLAGTIDLVARVDGRYGVLDYKSNWLTGASASPDGARLSVSADYHPARLAEEMVSHDYVLQYHLYTVALHRFLRWRLGESYDYERDVYGALYLFLRGMTGPETPRASDGTPHGVYADRPSLDLVEDLDAVLRGVTR